MKKVIMILTNGFSPDLRVYKEAKYITTLGYDVEILCWDREKKFIDKPTEIFDNIKITRFYQESKYGSGLKQVFKLLKFKNSCKKYLKNINYDYMHCHDLDGMFVGYLLHKKNDKLIFDMHEFYNSGSYAKIYFLVKLMIKFLQNKSYKIIHVNDKQLEGITDKNKQKLIYIPNYPERNKFSSVRHIESDILRVTYVGYVRHLIPITTLIEASKDIEKLKVSIHGSGEILDKVKEMAKNSTNVSITGEFKHDEINKFYSESDIMYIVYNKGNLNDENALPTKFFEAIISGVPVIVAKNSLLAKEVERYDIGFCIDGDNVEELRELLSFIQKNKEVLNQKIANIEKIKNNYLWDEIVKNLENIYC